MSDKPDNVGPSVFISHSSADKDLARSLRKALEEHGIGVWNQDQILPGDRVDEMLEQGLKASQAIVLLISPHFLASEWCAFEMGAALSAANTSPKRRLIPLLMSGTNYADLPHALQAVSTLNLTDEEQITTVSEQIARATRQPLRTAVSAQG